MTDRSEMILAPNEIELESLRIISAELGLREQTLDSENLSVIKRVIHTTADFDYADNLYFSNHVIKQAVALFEQGANIVTDTKMSMSGINKPALEQTGSTVQCFIDSDQVVETARKSGSTRSLAAVDYAIATVPAPLVFLVGNAPTALLRLHQLIRESSASVELIIAVPVGFVNVVEAKQLIEELDVPQIVARGRKGGSNVAAAIVNALLYQTIGREL